MNKHDLQNERLDRIGRKLLEARKVSIEEIEKIVGAPQLFDSVKARIKNEQPCRKPKSSLGDWSNLFVWNRQNAAGAFAILIILAVCASVIIHKREDSAQLIEQTIKPEIQPQITQIENPLPTSEIKETKIRAVKNGVSIQQVTFKAEMSKFQNRARKLRLAKLSQNLKEQSPEVFYSLAVSGNWQADGEDLQVVRAELSESELFALGVNLPVENESAKVKTDLLVGRDGIARAIRFVE